MYFHFPQVEKRKFDISSLSSPSTALRFHSSSRPPQILPALLTETPSTLEPLAVLQVQSEGPQKGWSRELGLCITKPALSWPLPLDPRRVVECDSTSLAPRLSALHSPQQHLQGPLTYSQG